MRGAVQLRAGQTRSPEHMAMGKDFCFLRIRNLSLFKKCFLLCYNILSAKETEKVEVEGK